MPVLDGENGENWDKVLFACFKQLRYEDKSLEDYTNETSKHLKLHCFI